MNRSNGSWWGGILVALGILLLLENLDILSIGDAIRNYWPALLILGGIWILVQSGPRLEQAPAAAASSSGEHQVFGDVNAQESTDFLNYSTVLGDARIGADSKQFRGGTVSTVFGDCTIDCSHATFAEGEQSVRVSGVFGDLSVILPAGTVYALGAHTLFGSIHAGKVQRDGISSTVSYRPPEYDDTRNKVRLEISGVFGDIEVHA